MISQSIISHSKNISNFEALIADVMSLGEIYNPVKLNLKLPELNALLLESKSSIALINSTEPIYKAAVGERELAFQPLSKLITKVNNAIKVSDTIPQTLDNVKTIVRKLRGERATPKASDIEKLAATEAGKDIIEKSTSQMSYDSRLDNFDKLINLLTSIPTYMPNESDVQVATLQELYKDLRLKNSNVINSEIALRNARITRNEILYKSKIGLVNTALDVKIYLKSIFGPLSPQSKLISNLKFKRQN